MWSAIRPVAARSGLRVGTTTAAEAKVLSAARRFTKTATASGFTSHVHAHPSPSQLCISAFQQQARGFAAATTSTTTAAPKKAAPKKKTTAKKTTATKKKKVAKKAAKKVAKKAAKKVAKKAPRKVRTPEEKKKVQVQELKRAALLKEPSKLPEHPWILYVTENTKGTKTDGGKANLGQIMPELSQSFKSLSQLELQRLRDTAEKNRASNIVAQKAWVESHSVDQIVEANRARQHLKRLSKSKHRNIQDERLPKRPLSSFSIFTKERWETGQFTGRPIAEAAKTLGAEWKNLSASERQQFENRGKAESERYEKEVEAILGRPVAKSPPASP